MSNFTANGRFLLGYFPTDLVRLARPCWAKTKHQSRGSAEAQLQSLARRGYLHPAEGARAYTCPFCLSWHIGRLRKVRRENQGWEPTVRKKGVA